MVGIGTFYFGPTESEPTHFDLSRSIQLSREHGLRRDANPATIQPALSGSEAFLAWREWVKHHPPEIVIVALIHFVFRIRCDCVSCLYGAVDQAERQEVAEHTTERPYG